MLDLTDAAQWNPYEHLVHAYSWQALDTEEKCENTLVTFKAWYQAGTSTWYVADSGSGYGSWYSSPIAFCADGLNINVPSSATRIRIMAQARRTDLNQNRVVQIFTSDAP